MRLTTLLACTLLATLLTSPALSSAQSNGDSSEIDQYSEQIPSGGGDKPTKNSGQGGGGSTGADAGGTGSVLGADAGAIGESGTGSSGDGGSGSDGSGPDGSASGLGSDDDADAGDASPLQAGSGSVDRAVKNSALQAGVIPTNADDDAIGLVGVVLLVGGALSVVAGLVYWMRRRRAI